MKHVAIEGNGKRSPRFGRGESARPWSDDVEFVALTNASTPSHWIVQVRGLRTLGPYEKLAEAWIAWRGMDVRERSLLQIGRRR